MSAGTVGFTDTRTDTNHIGSVISRILEARQLAEDERKYAEEQAKKNKTTLEEAGIKRGDFFKKALRWKFGGEFKQKKLSQLNTWKKRGSLLKGVATGNSKGNKLNRFERSQALFDIFKASDKPKTFRDKFKPLYKGFVKDPVVKPKSELVKPGTAKKIQKATTSKSNKRVSKEDILDSIAGITNAIEKIAESISEKNKIVSDQMIHSSVLQGMIHTQLKTNGDSLEEKLQKIVDAISNQTQYKKEAVDKAKSRDAENKLEAQKDVASVRKFDNLLTKEDESIERPSGGYPELSQMGHAGMDVSGVGSKTPPMYMPPQAEQGAIFSGPDSGYLVELHGKERVVPLDNNYTQGEPSAVDGKVRPKPTEPIAKPKSMPSNNIQKFEMGTNNKPAVSSSPITSKFGFDTARNQMGIAGGGTTQQSKMSQSMVDVMSLPMMAAGGTILASTTKYMQSLGGEGADIKPEIERVARPIAETFGLPPSIVNKAKQGSAGKSTGVGKSGGEDGESNKNILAKLMDGFGAMLDKMKDSINTTPPPDPTGTAQPADISGNEKELLKRLMIAEAGGEGVEGMAMVGQSVLNRASLIQSGTVGAGQFNAASGSVTDVIQGENQYQPYRQGKLNRALSPEENARAEEAYNLLKNMPEFKKRIKQAFNLSDRQVQLGAAATGFRNYDAGAGLDTSQQVNEFKAGSHTWNTAGNAGLRVASSDVKVAQPTPPPTPTPLPKPVSPGQSITNNYGLKVGQERTFTVPGYGEVKARKTTVGFDFYGPGMNNKLDLSKPQGKTIVEHFKKTNGGQTISPPEEKIVSSLSPGNKGDSESGNIAMLNIGTGGPQTFAGSSPPPSQDGRGTQPGTNQIRNFYSDPFSIAIS